MPLRIGFVSEINHAERKVRVKFPDTEIISDWLKIVTTTNVKTMIDVEYRPKLNDNVLCIFNDGFNADGYVLGALL